MLKWFTVSGETRKEAEAKRAALVKSVADGTYVEPSKLTLPEFMRGHFLPDLVAKGRLLKEWRRRWVRERIRIGADLDVVAELLGDEIQTVKKHYVGEREKAKRAAVERLSRYLDPRSTAGTHSPATEEAASAS